MTGNKLDSNKEGGSKLDVVANELDCDDVVSSNSSCTFTFTYGQKALVKAWSHSSSTYELNKTITVLLEGWLRH